jgi:CheY-like chemotaxis protein
METPLRILVAEDELGDVLLLRRAFEKAQVKAPIHFARDGQEVMDYLQGRSPFDNPVEYPLPTLLLLDLNLPFINGFEILQRVREHPALRHMIIVVFSCSDQAETIKRAYSMGANAYIVKPQDPDDLVRVIDQLQTYWRSINTPSEEPTDVSALATLA